MIDLEGKVALVTGSSRGIGRACALTLARAGAHVVINYLTSQRAAQEVAEAVRALGRQASVVKADVSEARDTQAMVGFIEETYGRLDILVSNVATGGFRPLLETSPEHLNAVMNHNVTPTIALVRAALHLLSGATGPGKVIVLSSHGAHRALAGYGAIGASKAALESTTRQLAFELGQQGINFNVVLAGLVATDSTRDLPGARATLATIAERLLVREELSAAHIADAVLFLASPLSDLVQGHTLVVDGGVGIQ